MNLQLQYPVQTLSLQAGTWYAVVNHNGETVGLHLYEGDAIGQVQRLQRALREDDHESMRRQADKVDYHAVVVP